ncbi:MAG: RdgB/HAM1 family non-canonical purine NTP pyrophosphatase, partial [Acidimicrobiia bacterium]|nr:RdgB/HAM1 family non-canonical purine NTP pyrophosphatase [Acidimicrobiia bacterium]
VVLATQNPGKVAEISDLLAPLAFTVRPRPEGLAETVEDADTLEGNAAKKAREVCAATGSTALADDTGLFVDALGGAPGVHTARYGGWERLLNELDGVADRSARFRTVLVMAFPDARPDLLVDGVAEGEIAEEPGGDGGFGYDPVFLPDAGDGRSFAEMSKAEKNTLSHRGIALRRLVESLAQTRSQS